MPARRVPSGDMDLYPAIMALPLLLAAPAAALDGWEVIAKAQARNGYAQWTDRRSVVSIETEEDGRGRRREAEIFERTAPAGEHKTLIVFTAPEDARGMRLLHVSPRGEPDTYWVRYPGTGRVRRLGGNAAGSAHRDEIFTGTDASYRDLELLVRVQQWDASVATATLAGEEPCDPVRCWRVDLVPKARNEFPLSRYRLWYGQDDFWLRRAELDDLAGVPVERIGCTDYFASGRFLTARQCTIEHLRTKVRAVITTKEAAYDTGLDDAVFSVAHLSNEP